MIEEYMEPTFASFIKNNLGTLLASVLTIVGVVISIYFGFDNWKKSEKEKLEKKQLDNSLKENTEELKVKTQKIEEQNIKIQLLNEEIKISQNQVINKAKTIQELNNRINIQLEDNFKPHVIYRFTGFENSSLKLMFINIGGQILRNPVLHYKFRARLSKGEDLLLDYESPITTITEYTDEVKFGWSQYKVWEVKLFAGFPSEKLPEYDRLYIDYQFKMDVNGYTSIKEETDWLYTRTIIDAYLNDTTRNKISQPITEFKFHKVK